MLVNGLRETDVNTGHKKKSKNRTLKSSYLSIKAMLSLEASKPIALRILRSLRR